LQYLERRILSIYATLVSLKKTEAEIKYMELAKKITLFGVTLFDVTQDGVSRKLGIAEDGFLISTNDQKVIASLF
jgi:hypothetical protein